MSLPLFDKDTPSEPRVCSWLFSTAEGPPKPCRKVAVLHLLWKIPLEGEVIYNWVCASHRAPTLDRWTPDQRHYVGPCCGMPGSEWDEAENRCKCQEIPVTKILEKELAGV